MKSNKTRKLEHPNFARARDRSWTFGRINSATVSCYQILDLEHYSRREKFLAKTAIKIMKRLTKAEPKDYIKRNYDSDGNRKTFNN